MLNPTRILHRRCSILALTALAVPLTTCSQPSSMPTLGGPPGTSGVLYSLAVFDDGSGPALYAGGNFTTAGGAPANYIARWSGSSWSQLGSGMNGYVNALTVFN